MLILSRSEKETFKLGQRIARFLQKSDIVCLSGGLGAGKTVLAKGIACGLGVKSRSVISPTFVLLCSYAGKVPLYHLDLYRLGARQDILNLGYEEYLYAEAVTVIEWAERLGRLRPRECLSIELKIDSETQRRIRLLAQGERYKELIRKLR